MISPSGALRLIVVALWLLAGCSDDDDTMAMPLPDAAVDGGADGGPDADLGPCPPARHDAPTVTACAAAGAEGCELRPGSGDGLLITADILTPDGVREGGQIYIDGTGTIACADCSCGGVARGAPELYCPDAVVSPGLINTHDHLDFVHNMPYSRTDERYEHRSDWRLGSDGHSELDRRGSATLQAIAYAELRQLMAGTTSINGVGDAPGLLRNLDVEGKTEGLGNQPVDGDTFPLGDLRTDPMAASCDYPSMRTNEQIRGEAAYTPHLAEGISAAARNEVLCVLEGRNDLIEPQTAVIHGVGVKPPEIAAMAAEGTSLIWSPRTNVTLYGDTARVTEYATLGVPIALGTDWLITGSMNMLRELVCADELNRDYFQSHFSDADLWRMATANAAAALGVEDRVGSLVANHVADIAVYRKSGRRHHRAVLEAGPGDVVLVLRGGKPLYGDADVVAGLANGCERMNDVCGSDKRACVMDEVGLSLSQLRATNSSNYDLYFCGIPAGEPSCVPDRNASGSLPSPEVNGSGRYTGLPTQDDQDGDGLIDGIDNCGCVFNPTRPLDDGTQADFDDDGVGDACDPCPLLADSDTCAPPDPNDLDGDGIPNHADNCTSASNPGQEDADGDQIGDPCDDCPETPNPGGAACPASIYDIKGGSVSAGANVAINDLVVTGVGDDGFFAQLVPTASAYEGPERSGIFVYTGGTPEANVGERIRINAGRVAEFFDQTQLTNVSFVVVERGVAAPVPVEIQATDIPNASAERAEELEGVLVRVSNLSVTDTSPPSGPGDRDPANEFEVNGSLRVDDYLYLLDPPATLDQAFDAITGILAHRNGFKKLEPRSADDFELAL